MQHTQGWRDLANEVYRLKQDLRELQESLLMNRPKEPRSQVNPNSERLNVLGGVLSFAKADTKYRPHLFESANGQLSLYLHGPEQAGATARGEGYFDAVHYSSLCQQARWTLPTMATDRGDRANGVMTLVAQAAEHSDLSVVVSGPATGPATVELSCAKVPFNSPSLSLE